MVQPQSACVPGPGCQVGEYRLVREAGSGGMATVFEAVHRRYGRTVALKVLQPQYAGDPELRRRFLNEARSLKLLRHPSLVRILEYGMLDGGGPYMVLEYLDGLPLHERAGTLPLEIVLAVAQQIAAALSAAHGRGIVHRDLKPANVILVPDPAVLGGRRAKIVDFGIAKVLDAGEDGELEPMDTRHGIVMGTPAYMAPEQCQGASQATDRADVYALGVILYEQLTGRLPFTGGPIPLMMQHISQPPCPLRRRNAAVPEEVAALVHRMMAKDPQDRPPMAQVDRELRRLLALALVPGLTGEDTAAPSTLVSGLTPPRVMGKKTVRARRWAGVLWGLALALVLMVALCAGAAVQGRF